MSRRCEVTGKGPNFGNLRSHSNIKTRMRQDANIKKQRFWLASEKRWVRLTLSTSAIRTIAKKGIDAVIRDMRQRGVSI